MKNKIIYIFGSVVFFIDQFTKMFIDKSATILNGFLFINPVNNYGAAWSLFNNKTIMLIAFSILMFLVLLRFQCFFVMNKRNKIAFGLVYGGLLGNLLDRMVLGYVRDFIEVLIFNYNFPIFNIADTAIVIGVFLLIIAILKGEDKVEKNSSK